jgi:hypothetical protein
MPLRAVLNTNCRRVPKKVDNFLTTWKNISFSKRAPILCETAQLCSRYPKTCTVILHYAFKLQKKLRKIWDSQDNDYEDCRLLWHHGEVGFTCTVPTAVPQHTASHDRRQQFLEERNLTMRSQLPTVRCSSLPFTLSALVQTGPGSHPASSTMGTGSFPGVKRPRRGVHHPPHLAPRLKKE